eukprot:CAMPEP_0114617446 /NCGR_PEP_ID=MMETSP0168-20121206/7202_1 /TAXON_ID=95228 ORGANISM="Vannella sp., Strain DIVA3 517/6/12" /NCGR_SAMPLE_ID=MMETSP0168 /ASSEMBLY_ACC=CAM_ASM_000044 /LENGTH=106 /DNA_ID=CAMNT_0001828583 /DNA_START=71 /DNA_END=388 /DNA_ORIENTATION=+
MTESTAVPFERFDFDNNEEWKTFLSRVDLGASLDPSAALQRLKRKWYARTYGAAPADRGAAAPATERETERQQSTGGAAAARQMPRASEGESSDGRGATATAAGAR